MKQRIIYVSKSHQKMPLDLKDILASSRKNNVANQVSGAMTHLDGVYMQYLEGEEQVLDKLYATIVADPRHAAPRLLARDAIRDRVFPAWSMGLITWNDQTAAIYRSFNPEEEMDLYRTRPESAGTFFQTLSRSSNWLAAG